ncbi:MAG TPA: 30S ribosomal protein S18 [Nitrospiria bacterium]|jgi:small subunit ribosomal protein S18
MEKRRFFQRRKTCRFCVEKVLWVDYKNTQFLRDFLSDRGKIIPSRISGNCAKHQRDLGVAIKRARNIALLAFAEEG